MKHLLIKLKNIIRGPEKRTRRAGFGPQAALCPQLPYKHSPKPTPKPTPKPPHPNKWGLYTLSPSLIKMLTLFHTPVGVLLFSPFYYRVYFVRISTLLQYFDHLPVSFDHFCSMVISIGWPVSLKQCSNLETLCRIIV